MASINGVRIKNLKTFRGHEGESCAQGDIWLNGQKLGFWSQDSWGGPDRFDFDENILKDACTKFKEGHPSDYKYIDFCDEAEIFLGVLTSLMDTEKRVKRFFKRGYKVAVVLTNDIYMHFFAAADERADSYILKKYEKEIERIKADLGGDVTLYTVRPRDFDIKIDREHPVPTYLMS